MLDRVTTVLAGSLRIGVSQRVSVCLTHNEGCVHTVPPKGLVNHSYMHGVCGSISTQYALSARDSAMRQLIALPYLLIAGFAPMSEGLPSENLIQTNFGEFLYYAVG